MIIVWKKDTTKKCIDKMSMEFLIKNLAHGLIIFSIGHGRTFLSRVTDLLRLSNIEMLLTNK